MESKKDIFTQWEEERNKESWIFRKLRFMSLWWNHDGKYLHLEFKNGVKNLIYWLPVIWKDRNSDSDFIYEVIKHKLSSQSDFIGKNNNHTRALQDAKRMRICVSLIQKLQDSVYSLEYTDYEKERHWFEPCEDSESYSWESENIWENYDKLIKKYPLIYKKVLNGEGSYSLDGKNDIEIKKLIVMSICSINEKRANRLLFKIMESEINKWWN